MNWEQHTCSRELCWASTFTIAFFYKLYEEWVAVDSFIILARKYFRGNVKEAK